MPSIRTIIRVGSSALLMMLLGMTARASEWQRGDVFVAVGNGEIQVYRLTTNGEVSSYNLIETLTDGSGTVSGENGSGGTGYTTGCGFDSTNHLYTTNFSNGNVYKFSIPDPHTVLQTIPASEGAQSSESLVFDGQGNLFVGHADGNHVVDKFDPNGNFLQSFTVAAENRGSDWIELSSDGNTLYYTSEGVLIKTFNVSTNTQGLDFFSEEGGPMYNVKILPPSFGSFAGNFLVANTANILRLQVGEGGGGFVAQTYTVPNASALFTIALDTNGTSFWAGDLGTGNLYRINVASGAIEFGPIATGAVPNNNDTASLAGICVNGAAGAAQPQPVVQTVTLTPTHNTGTVANDNNSNTLSTTLNGLTQTAHVTVAFTEIQQSAGNSNIPGYGQCELQSADGSKCVVHQVSVDTTAFTSIDFYHHWSFKPPTPINPRMIKNESTDITTAVYLDPGTKGHTVTPSTYVDNEAPTTTGASCGFIFPPNNFHWEAEYPLTFLFDAVATGSPCNKGPFLNNIQPIISLGRLGTNGSVISIKLPATSFHDFHGVWYYTLATKSLKPGTYIVSVFDQSNQIPAFSEQIVIVPED